MWASSLAQVGREAYLTTQQAGGLRYDDKIAGATGARLLGADSCEHSCQEEEVVELLAVLRGEWLFRRSGTTAVRTFRRQRERRQANSRRGEFQRGAYVGGVSHAWAEVRRLGSQEAALNRGLDGRVVEQLFRHIPRFDEGRYQERWDA